jgi:hypothetical protein
MSDLMLHGVLNMPLPDNPKDLGQIEWMQFRDRARQASKHITALTAERDALALQVQRARDDALEEAALEAERGADTLSNMNKVWRNGCRDAAAAIRALRTGNT